MTQTAFPALRDGMSPDQSRQMPAVLLRLWQQAPAPFRATYEVLGVPLALATNAPAVLELAEEVFGAPVPEDPGARPRVRMTCFVHDAAETPCSAPSPLCRFHDDCYLMSAGGSLGMADRTRGAAVAFVTPALIEERVALQQRFMETLALFLITRDRPATFHAAGLACRDAGVLITGESGAGKSTMAYACLRAGFDLLAEDEVFAVPDPGYEWFFCTFGGGPQTKLARASMTLRAAICCPGWGDWRPRGAIGWPKREEIPSAHESSSKLRKNPYSDGILHARGLRK